MINKVASFIYYVILVVSAIAYLATDDIKFAVIAIIYAVFSAENTIMAEIKNAREDD